MSSDHSDVAIYIKTHNRKGITEKCLERISQICSETGAVLFLIDDFSDEYDLDFLRQYTPHVRQMMNTHLSIRERCGLCRHDNLVEFKDSTFAYCYFTDNDVFHDRGFLDEGKRLELLYKEPVTLYRSNIHVKTHIEGCFYSQFQGTSLLFSKEGKFLEVSINSLEKKSPRGWDWRMGSYNKFVFSEYSYVEHFQKDSVNSKNPKCMVSWRDGIVGDIAENLLPSFQKEILDGPMREFYQYES